MKAAIFARQGLKGLEKSVSIRGTMFLLAFLFLLSSCAPKQRINAPVYRPEQSQPQPMSTTERPSGQTAKLLAEAEKTLEAGHPDRAEMLLERAMRLSSGDARLWQLMARVRLAQGNSPQAVQFCLKSNSLAGGDTTLLRQNWLLLEKAYLAGGDEQKATQARLKAEQLP